MNWADHDCTQCVNWDVSNDSHDLLKYYPGTNYPGKTYLHPKPVSSVNLQTALDRAHYGVVYERWNKTTFNQFCRVNGINDEFICMLTMKVLCQSVLFLTAVSMPWILS